MCPGLFARVQGRVRAGSQVAGGGAGLRLLNISNTHKWGRSEEPYVASLGTHPSRGSSGIAHPLEHPVSIATFL